MSSIEDEKKKVKIQATTQEKVFAKYLSDKGLVSKIFKYQLKLNNKKMGRRSEDTSPEKIYRWQISVLKKSQKQVKTILRYHYVQSDPRRCRGS